MNTIATFVEGQFYHIYNRTNNKEHLFLSEENRRYFLSRYRDFLRPFVITHAYALLSNHFHFSIRIKSRKEVIFAINKIPLLQRTKLMQMCWELDNAEVSARNESCSMDWEYLNNALIIHQFQSFFNSYTKAFNKYNSRKGNLFNRTFKRSLYDPQLRFKNLIYYIHHNARKHNIVDDFLEYPFHSYFEIVNEDSNIVNTDEVLSLFGSKKTLIEYHSTDLFIDKFEGFRMDLNQ